MGRSIITKGDIMKQPKINLETETNLAVLKSHAYDMIALINNAQRELQFTERRIQAVAENPEQIAKE